MDSDFFKREEFACNCGCGFDTVDTDLLNLLNAIRAKFGPVRITSGCRCPEYNKKIGGSPGSQHQLGRAADIQINGVEPKRVADFAESLMPDHGGVGRYASFTHVDSRNARARWGSNE